MALCFSVRRQSSGIVCGERLEDPGKESWKAVWDFALWKHSHGSLLGSARPNPPPSLSLFPLSTP